jgi:hypothetical protein
MADRKKRFGSLSSGALACLMFAPRDFFYVMCGPCGRLLYFTYPGEACPFCGKVITEFIAGDVPEPDRPREGVHERKRRRRGGRKRERRQGRRTMPQGKFNTTGAA